MKLETGEIGFFYDLISHIFPPKSHQNTWDVFSKQHIQNHYTAPPPPPTESYGKSPSSSFPTYSAVPHDHPIHPIGPAPIEEPLFDGYAEPPPPGKYQERAYKNLLLSDCRITGLTQPIL